MIVWDHVYNEHKIFEVDNFNYSHKILKHHPYLSGFVNEAFIRINKNLESGFFDIDSKISTNFPSYYQSRSSYVIYINGKKIINKTSVSKEHVHIDESVLNLKYTQIKEVTYEIYYENQKVLTYATLFSEFEKTRVEEVINTPKFIAKIPRSIELNYRNAKTIYVNKYFASYILDINKLDNQNYLNKVAHLTIGSNPKWYPLSDKEKPFKNLNSLTLKKFLVPGLYKNNFEVRVKEISKKEYNIRAREFELLIDSFYITDENTGKIVKSSSFGSKKSIKAPFRYKGQVEMQFWLDCPDIEMLVTYNYLLSENTQYQIPKKPKIQIDPINQKVTNFRYKIDFDKLTDKRKEGYVFIKDDWILEQPFILENKENKQKDD
ncbi:hypothetical protein [Mycoplasmopsis gallinacea]|uniref:Uncharacterized protein n=1 Tax=Mycoplasmopsis gallinacea TaxID=29556 RepID=A0A6H0V1B4_9BACT|nr:hypothetical protein [Mycoplasmopsis gallinacea]QIW62131.1 hypothetical protein GOQ20_01570 [Mycoplasmopsis gallinacea]